MASTSRRLEALVKAGALALDDFAAADLSGLLVGRGDVRRGYWQEFECFARVTDYLVVGVAVANSVNVSP